MEISKKGLDLIKKHEGLRLKSYICPAGKWTIGYGHTKTAEPDQFITEATAEELLKLDLSTASRAVLREIESPTQNQFDALVSFVFNVGSGNFRRSTLLKRIRDNADEEEIRNQFYRWVYANKNILGGLVKRRKDEADLYFSKE